MKVLVPVKVFVAMLLAAAFGAKAHTAIAFSTKNPLATTFVATGHESQKQADDVAVQGCNAILATKNLTSIQCDGLERQPSKGYGAMACQIIKCYFGYSPSEGEARGHALTACKSDAQYNDFVRSRCGIGIPKGNGAIEIAGSWLDSATPNRQQTGGLSAAVAGVSIYGLQVGRTKISAIKPCEGKQLPRGQDYCWNTHRQVGEDPAKDFVLAQEIDRYDIVINGELFDVSALYTNPLLGTYSWVEAWAARDGTIQWLRFYTGFPANNQVLDTLTDKFGQPSSVGKTDWFDSVTKQPLVQSRITEWKSKGLYVLFAEKANVSADNPKADRGSVEISVQELKDKLVAHEKRKRGNTRGM